MNVSILCLSLRTLEGDFFLADPDPQKGVPGVPVARGAGNFSLKVAYSSPFLVSKESVAQSPLCLHCWKVSSSTLMVLSPVMMVFSIPGEVQLFPHGAIRLQELLSTRHSKLE